MDNRHQQAQVPARGYFEVPAGEESISLLAPYQADPNLSPYLNDALKGSVTLSYDGHIEICLDEYVVPIEEDDDEDEKKILIILRAIFEAMQRTRASSVSLRAQGRAFSAEMAKVLSDALVSLIQSGALKSVDLDDIWFDALEINALFFKKVILNSVRQENGLSVSLLDEVKFCLIDCPLDNDNYLAFLQGEGLGTALACFDRLPTSVHLECHYAAHFQLICNVIASNKNIKKLKLTAGEGFYEDAQEGALETALKQNTTLINVELDNERFNSLLAKLEERNTLIAQYPEYKNLILNVFSNHFPELKLEMQALSPSENVVLSYLGKNMDVRRMPVIALELDRVVARARVNACEKALSDRAHALQLQANIGVFLPNPIFPPAVPIPPMANSHSSSSSSSSSSTTTSSRGSNAFFLPESNQFDEEDLDPQQKDVQDNEKKRKRPDNAGSCKAMDDLKKPSDHDSDDEMPPVKKIKL